MSHQKLTITEMNRLTPSRFKQAHKTQLAVVLDNVRSQHNIGAVFRTADAFLLHSIALCGICCCPPNDEIHKTALGAEQTVEWNYFKDTLDAVQTLHQQGFTIYAVEQTHNSLTLEQMRTRINPDSKVAVVFGHEVFGVNQQVIDACDGCIEIPQFGTKHSLNVSVTAGIVLYTLSQILHS